MSYYYLASPYSHDLEEVREARYKITMKAAVSLMRDGLTIYSPIVHFHEMAKEYSLPKDFKYWQGVNRKMIRKSIGLIVLTMPGWRESVGVQGEIKFAEDHNKIIKYLEPSEI